MMHPQLKIKPDPIDRNKVIAYGLCSCCQEHFSHSYSMDGLRTWMNGNLIQRALPDVSPEWREWLKTAICDACWEKQFSI
jgi:hypothetical protein